MAKITIDDLAKMVKNGFDGVDKKFEQVNERLDKTATKEQFDGLHKRLGEVEKTLKVMDDKLSIVSTTEKRVDYIEGVLNLSAQKN